MKALVIAFPATALLAAVVLALIPTAPVGETAWAQVHAPRKDGSEVINLSWKKDDVNDSLSVTVTGINGPKDEHDEDDPEQTTPYEKAQKFADAINAAADQQGKPINATVVLDSVTVACPGGHMENFKPSNNTREKDVLSLPPGAGQIAQASFEIYGPAAGIGEDGQPSIVTIGVGSTQRSFNVSAGMSDSALRTAIRNDFDGLGFRTSIVNTAVLIVLPTGSPTASLDYNDAAMTASVGISVF